MIVSWCVLAAAASVQTMVRRLWEERRTGQVTVGSDRPLSCALSEKEERTTGQWIVGSNRPLSCALSEKEERTTGQVIVGSDRPLSKALSEMEDRVKEFLRELDAQVSHLDRERDRFPGCVEQCRQAFREAEELLEKSRLTMEELKQKTLELSQREEEKLKTEEASAAAPSPAQDLPLPEDKVEVRSALQAKIERIEKKAETELPERKELDPGTRMTKMRAKMQRKEDRAKKGINEIKASMEKESKKSCVKEVDEEAAVRLNKMRTMKRREQEMYEKLIFEDAHCGDDEAAVSNKVRAMMRREQEEIDESWRQY